MTFWKHFISLLFVFHVISGCAPLIVGGAATAGYLAIQERGIKTAVMDAKIKTHIKDKLTNLDYHYLTEIDVSVLGGDVLLTGVVKSDQALQEIRQKVRETEGVGEIYNDLFIGNGYTPEQYASDSWISSRIRARLLTAKEVYSVNYMLHVVNNHVYLLGVSGSGVEKQTALHIARTTKGVTQVHDYIRITTAD